MILAFHNSLNKMDDDDTPTGDSSSGNSGTLLLDATCAPSIKSPEDVELLKDGHQHSEQLIAT